MVPPSSSSFSSLFLSLTSLFLCAVSRAAAGSNAASQAWLAENSRRDGVVTLPSGLQYKVLRRGGGDAHPAVHAPCRCHYAGTLIDGTTFDSSYDRGDPTTFAPNQVIAGWTEAMQLMVEGDKWEMYVPSELGYGDRGSPPKIGGGDALIFVMEILTIDGDKVPALRCNVFSNEHCSEQETAYVMKVKEKFGFERGRYDLVQQELERVNRVTIQNPKVSPTNLAWGKRRAQILGQVVAWAKDEL